MKPTIPRMPESKHGQRFPGLEHRLNRLRRKPCVPPPNIRRHVDPGSICHLVFDRHGSSANLFDEVTLHELHSHLDWLGSNAATIHGLVFETAKPGIFIAGADLKSINEESAARMIALGQEVFDRIEALPMPTVAAIDGACVGGGFELALACDYRIASDRRASKVGLPEIKLGILPAWGGSTRLPRLIGLRRALGLILRGKVVAASEHPAIDHVVAREHLTGMATKLIDRGKVERRPRRSLTDPLVRWKARRDLAKKALGNLPAPVRALEVAAGGLRRSHAESLRLEREAATELIATPESKNLIRRFFEIEAAKKQSGDPLVDRAAVIGAGVMGAGIAHALSKAGLPCLLSDVDPEAVARGMRRIHQLGGETDRITPTSVDLPMGRVDLVVEAAVEKLAVKQQIFEYLDQRCAADTIIATNTSALPIRDIAASTKYPHRIIGLHFFNPVHRMQLVEVIAGEKTSHTTIDRSMALVRRLGKVPILVEDSPGFLVNRILVPYLLEAIELFDSGVSPILIDRAMRQFGMPVGPLRLVDEVGMDVALHVAETLAASFPDRMAVPELLPRLVEHGKLGRKSGAGFYRYGRNHRPDPAVVALRREPATLALEPARILAPLHDKMRSEARRCLDEGIAKNAADINLAMVLGTGYPAFREGLLS